MGKLSSRSVFRAAGLCALVLAIVAVMTWPAAYLLPCPGTARPDFPGFREAVNRAPDIWWALLPQLTLYALVITVFTMNRIRTAALVALTALLVMIFISSLSRCALWRLMGSEAFWRFHYAFAELMPEGVDAFFVYTIILLLLLLAGAFLIIKIVAAAERAFMSEQEEPA